MSPKNKNQKNKKPSEGLHVVVMTYDLKTEDLVRERTINYESPEERRWLASHLMWAMHNNMSVELMNHSDHKRLSADVPDN